MQAYVSLKEHLGHTWCQLENPIKLAQLTNQNNGW